MLLLSGALSYAKSMVASAGVWLGFSTDGSTDGMIWASIVMLSIVACCVFCISYDIYLILPGWGAVRKFDSDSNETLRINQYLIHEEAERLDAAPAPHEKHYYGAAPGLHKPTWGICEKPGREVPFPDPVKGPYKLREGFNETQKLRQNTWWWGRDEPHFIAEEGFRQTPNEINEVHVQCNHRMV
mmetsp:Transcript_80765/g.140203  ORF Transcript_80765/g.140203 Transcript_80765/m.140203 type:complete len:185 (-) Transcript_80765:71-625(-)